MPNDTQPADLAAPAKKRKTEYHTVDMRDGRSVEFPTTAKAKKEILLGEDEQPTGVRFDFANGETRSILLTDLAALQSRLAVHGLSQKGGDSYASEKDVEDAIEALDDTIKTLLSGKWSEGRVGGGFAGVSVLARALSEVYGRSLDDVRTILKEMTPKEKMQLRQADGIREVVQRIEAEKAAAAGVDTGELLGRFAT